MKTKKVSPRSKIVTSRKRSFRPNSFAAIMAIVVAFGGLGVYLLSSSFAATGVVVYAATYNILAQHNDASHPLPSWVERRAAVFQKISDMSPGIIGMQEVSYIHPVTGQVLSQRGDVAAFMKSKGYAYQLGSSENGSPLFWKTGTFTVLARKEVKLVARDPNATQGGSARFLTYVRLSKGGKNISVFNYHFNHYREKSAQLTKLRDYYKAFKYAGDNVIFTGDFNGYDLEIRNLTGLWRVDQYSGVDHIMASQDVSRRSWINTGKGDPPASDHALIGAGMTLN